MTTKSGSCFNQSILDAQPEDNATTKATDGEQERKDTKAGQARERRARKRARKEAHSLLTNDMKVLEVQEAVTRAPRSETDQAGKQHRIGAHVSAMVRQLLFWEGKGEAEGGWIYKSALDWEQADAALTASKLRTARRVAVEEGLWEERQQLRPGDQRPTVYYRLDMLRVAEVVVFSELQNTHRLLQRERRGGEREKLNRKRRELEKARDDLRLIGMGDTEDSTHNQPCQFDRGTVSKYQGSHNKMTPLQESTSGDVPAGDFVCQTTLPEGLEASPASQDNASSAPTTPTDTHQTLEEHHTPASGDDSGEAAKRADRLRGAMDASLLGEDAPGVGSEQLGRLLRGEGGRSGEDVLGPMVARYFAGSESVELLAWTARGFVAPDRSLEYVLGAVEVHLEEIAVEESMEQTERDSEASDSLSASPGEEPPPEASTGSEEEAWRRRRACGESAMILNGFRDRRVPDLVQLSLDGDHDEHGEVSAERIAEEIQQQVDPEYPLEEYVRFVADHMCRQR